MLNSVNWRSMEIEVLTLIIMFFYSIGRMRAPISILCRIQSYLHEARLQLKANHSKRVYNCFISALKPGYQQLLK